MKLEIGRIFMMAVKLDNTNTNNIYTRLCYLLHAWQFSHGSLEILTPKSSSGSIAGARFTREET